MRQIPTFYDEISTTPSPSFPRRGVSYILYVFFIVVTYCFRGLFHYDFLSVSDVEALAGGRAVGAAAVKDDVT